MSQKRLQGAIESAKEALESLQEGVASLTSHPEQFDLLMDAVIKRFEVLFEYTWKLLKTAAEFEGLEAPGPRPAIQEAVRLGWIKDPEFWALALDARNGSVHDYFGISHEEYLRIIKRFADEVAGLLKELSKRYLV